MCMLYGTDSISQRIYFATAHDLEIAESCTGDLAHYNLKMACYEEDTVGQIFKYCIITSFTLFI